MRRNLTEQLSRISELMGLNEEPSIPGLKPSIEGADPKKADTVKDDLSDFYETLEKAAEGDGISQQEKGSMTFKNEVESMQIGLSLLGYNLPNHGIDGLFGPETASAVKKFTDEYVVTSKSGSTQSSLTMVKATKEMLLKMIELLKLKNITKEDISKLINASRVGLRDGGANVSLEGVAASDFNKIIDIIIDNLEGGYYHPDMLQDGRVKDSRYGSSGETMFGMDRKAGNTESTQAGREFWSLIDAENAREKWPWNYMGGSLAPKLKAKVAEIMKPNFENYLGRFMSEEARKIVMSDAGLTFNFAYAVWNGPGWFQRFARVINEKVASGVTDPKELLRIAVDTRKNWSSSSNAANSLIAQGGRKIEKIVGSQLA